MKYSNEIRLQTLMTFFDAQTFAPNISYRIGDSKG